MSHRSIQPLAARSSSDIKPSKPPIFAASLALAVDGDAMRAVSNLKFYGIGGIVGRKAGQGVCAAIGDPSLVF
ncbi:hypothetical protein AB9F26_21260 [Falsihalocynthiibacter sp. BN13B15]|uniref:hypothetical protein n=1 Tax=Falsihalocynthiibacter sp. BN13B15 TaxID=3240871 RepID=UPI00350EC291